MPLRSEVLTKRWSTANLPILPFLAPRVFQPWPSSRGKSRRTHSSAEAKQTSPKNALPNYDGQPGLPKILPEDPPSTIIGRERRARRNPDDGGCKHTTWGDGVLKYPKDTTSNAQRIGKSGITVWKPLGLGGSDQEVDLLMEISNGTGKHQSARYTQGAQAIEGSVNSVWKPANVETLDLKNDLAMKPSANTGDQHQGDGNGAEHIQDRMRNSEFAEEDPSTPRNSLEPSATISTTEGIGPSRLLNWRPTLPTNPERNAKKRFFYWRNMFDRLLASAESAPAGNNLDRNTKASGFIRKHLYQLHHEDLQGLWNDMVRLDQTGFEKLWNGLTEKSRLRLWPGLMITALQQRPSEALKLLAITYTDPLPPDYAISDTLDYLISYSLSAKRDSAEIDDANTVVSAHNLQKTVTKWLRLHPRVRISQKSMYTLISALDGDQLRVFYEDLRKTKHYLFPHTSIQIASRLAKSDPKYVKLSFEILEGLYGKINFDHPAIMSLCTTILYRSHQGPDAESTVAEKFQAMLGFGMKVNIIIYNVLIQNALRSGDPETAWKIHGMMIENDVKPDDHTYSILLNDAKWRMDSAAIRSVMGYLRENDIGGPYIATDLIHLIFLLHQNAEQASENESDFAQHLRRNAAFEKMLGKYCEHFHLEPLKNLIPNFLSKYPHASNPASINLIDPPAPTLVVMLTGLLYSLDSTATKELYERFVRLVGYQDPFALMVASNAYVWNVFLMSLGRFHDRLNDCPKVIKTMISSREETKEKLLHQTHQLRKSGQQDFLVPAEPDVHTWSILLHIFTKHNQLRAAEKIITAMQSRGTPPNEVTWTTLAFGYSRMQDVEKMADTIHRMEKGGGEVVDRTVAAMAGINDREGLTRALNKRKAQDQAEKDTLAAERA